MGLVLNPEALLAGPRGRRFCSALLDIDAWTWGKSESEAAGTGRLTAELTNAVSRVDLNEVARHSDLAAFSDALSESVFAVRYWQEADDQDLGPGGPVGLSPVEDSWGPSSAECRALVPRPYATIFEIGGPDDWIELVRRYPLAVPLSRRHDLWRVTGHDLRWAIPDYVAVAGDYDGVHLSVIGYLSTAGRALDAGVVQTVLAGWNPDQTWWLTEGTRTHGPRSGGNSTNMWNHLVGIQHDSHHVSGSPSSGHDRFDGVMTDAATSQKHCASGEGAVLISRSGQGHLWARRVWRLRSRG